MESYPPTVSDLQASFLSTRPGYRFDTTYLEKLPCPVESVGEKNVWGGISSSGGLDQNGKRHNEWCGYIGDRGRELATEAGVAIPAWGQMSQDPFRHLSLTLQWYREICRHPAITPAARLAREAGRVQKIRLEKERLEKHQEQLEAAVAWAAKEEEARREAAKHLHMELSSTQEAGRTLIASTPAVKLRIPQGLWSTGPLYEEDLIRRHRLHMADCRKRDALHMAVCSKRDAMVTKHGLIPSEAEAVLAHFGSGSFPKDTLAALRTINGFAAKYGIRFKDAETVLRE